ncbi:hypothetical protein AMECASPLE_023390, partial [Ameca splendens]
LELHYFWKWSAFEDYLLFCFGFTVVSAVVTLLLLDSVMFVETLGSLAVMFEAMLGIPQLLQNFHNSSTKGMSICNEYVYMTYCINATWHGGDQPVVLLKLIYY